MKTLPRALFISHGGGPLPLLGHPGHSQMVGCLQDIVTSIPRPEAILVISAHWEARAPTLTAGASPALIYDYHGFPPESYEIQYPCPGKPALAREIARMLGSSGFAAGLDDERGFDHGVFVPLKIMYPQADIPCVQLSLLDSLDPAQHIEMGAALQHLSDDSVLIVGSGLSFHNLKAFFSPGDPAADELNDAFEQWLQKTCSDPEISEQQRRELLINWRSAPGADFAHPREDHLMPLHVCYGVAQGPCRKMHPISIMDRKASMYVW